MKFKHLFKVYVKDKFYESFTEYKNAECLAKKLLQTEKEVIIFYTRTAEKVILNNEKLKILTNKI